MSFLFFDPSRPKTPQEVARAIKDSLMALDAKTVAEVKALEKARKDLLHLWSILLKQKVDSTCCCVEYIEKHLELFDFLVVCYYNKEIALNCGNMLRECFKFPTLAQ
ncbi:calcium-binding protein 39-like [Durio zibethinus]|uniref:Calcium-binding protein 39-like n=1 Tax=Durio zibethinus TaxID=66656 RepID=A0A6P5XKW2_DURZI|nr:calcium-binding protein 39-like [Durio zibethinus]